MTAAGEPDARALGRGGPGRQAGRRGALAQAALMVAGVAGAAWLALAWLHGGAADPVALCLAVPGAEGPARLAAMWVLMGAAMMLPTAWPALGLYGRLSARMEAGGGVHLAGFVSGYLAVWSAFGIAAAALQTAAAPALAGTDPRLAAGALIALAGAWQLTPWKAACLDACRNPLGFFMRHWAEGPAGALALGARHGGVCLGCCWAAMGLMGIAGAMNLAWMAALGILMLAEKTLPAAPLLGRLLGAAALLAGLALVAVSL